jgi:DHA1 family tetracycline resistance protein-like MFS transporter
MTNEVPANEQGELQGGLNQFNEPELHIWPLVYDLCVYFFTSPKEPVYLPGAPYFVAAALMLIGAYLLYEVLKKLTNTLLKL